MVHVLIIDGFSPPHKWLLNNNVKTTWFIKSNEINSFYKHNRIIGFPEYSNESSFIKTAKFIHSQDEFTHIFTFRERSLELACKIANELKLPYESKETVQMVNNKILMRKFLEENQLSTMKFKEVTSVNEVECFFRKVSKTPIILKPYNGHSSKNIHKISDYADIQNAWKSFRESGNDIGLCEEFISGKEYSVEAITINGKHEILGVTTKFKNKHFVEVGHVTPTNLSILLEKKVKLFIDSLLNLLKVKNSITHTELIITQDEDIKLVETHLRPGGDMIPDLLKLSGELNLYDVFFRGVLFKEPFHKNNMTKNYSAIWFKDSKGSGKIEKITNVDTVQTYDRCDSVILFKNIGDEIKETKDSSDRLCSVIVTAESEEQAIVTAKKMTDKIKYFVKNNEKEILL